MPKDDLGSRIIEEQRKLLDTLSEAAALEGWTCHYVVLSLDGLDLAADVRLTLGRPVSAASAVATAALERSAPRAWWLLQEEDYEGGPVGEV